MGVVLAAAGPVVACVSVTSENLVYVKSWGSKGSLFGGAYTQKRVLWDEAGSCSEFAAA